MKTLITSGCSFSYPENFSEFLITWPRHLHNLLPEYNAIYHGMGSQGNGLISRRVIYEVNSQLSQGVRPEDMLVGIMWSGTDRHDIYNPSIATELRKQKHIENWVHNPIGFIPDILGNWVILSPAWHFEENTEYYRHIHSIIGGTVTTLEHILRVQWFLKSHKIKYFMTTFTDEVFNSDNIKDAECKYLYDQIDFTSFLPVSSEHTWINQSSLPFKTAGYNHPDSEQHKLFTDSVIYPWLVAHKCI